MVLASIYSLYSYLSSPIGVTLDSLPNRLTETKKISWDLVLYVLTYNWLFIIHFIVPAIRHNTPYTYGGFVSLVKYSYKHLKYRGPSIWSYFTIACLHIWEFITMFISSAFGCWVYFLHHSWKDIQSNTLKGWSIFSEDMLPTLYEDTALATKTVTEDFLTEGLPHIVPDLRAGSRRVAKDIANGYVTVANEIGPQIMFDVVSGTTRHLAKGVILASCRVCKDIAAEGTKSVRNLRRHSYDLAVTQSRNLAIEGRRKVEKIRRNSWAYFSSDYAEDESVTSPTAGPPMTPRRRNSWANIFFSLDEVH